MSEDNDSSWILALLALALLGTNENIENKKDLEDFYKWLDKEDKK